MANKQFKTESKRLLDLMVHSIYSHKEIFLRELISNASDALDKLYYKSLAEGVKDIKKGDLAIWISADAEKRTLSIKDNGIGMSAAELEENLGTIAHSGSLDFKSDLAGQSGDKKAKQSSDANKIDVIGQFGVGFYSAFMVADHIIVRSKAYGQKAGNEWQSNGADGYSIKPAEISEHGTEIILNLKQNTGKGEDEVKYDEFAENYRLQNLIRKHSDYIRWPIKMLVEHTDAVDAESEDKGAAPSSHFEEETINSMVPLWKRPKSKVKQEEYNEFYSSKFYDYEPPLQVIHQFIEGVLNYQALLFLPSHAPFNYYSKEYQRGLSLYANGVLISENIEELIPDYFSFIKGVVDSPDVSLNISREILQQTKEIQAIATRLEKKIASDLSDLLKNKRDDYVKFWEAFGLQLKYGIQENYGTNKDKLQDLLLFYSSATKQLTTLKEYTQRMAKEQAEIYFLPGETVEKIDRMPQTESLKDEGLEILYLTDKIDEFALRSMREYDGKTFKSAADSKLEQSEADQKKAAKSNKDNAELLKAIKKALGDKVSEVKLSTRLKKHPVVLVSGDEGLSLEMEKILKDMPGAASAGADMPSASRVLELNAAHKIVKTLATVHKSEPKKLKTYADLLYNQALLIEGLPIDDPVNFADEIVKLMV